MSNKEPLAYWRGLYELISGLKTVVSDDYMEGELAKVEQQVLEGLNYFKRLPKGKEEDDGSKRPKDSKLSSLVKKLSMMIKLESSQTWEVLSNYLLYAFRGPAESLKKILISESKVNAVLADIYCFYCRERMFLLKSVTIILTQLKGYPHSDVYNCYLEKLCFPKLYQSLLNQLQCVKTAEAPEVSVSSSLVSSPLVNFWQEHNLLEQIQLTKLLIIVAPNILPSMNYMDSILNIIMKTSSAKRPGAFGKNDPRRQSLLKTLWDLEVLHFIQLLSFDKLPGNSIWTDEALFIKMDKNLKQGYQFDAMGSLLVSWLVVTYLCPLKNEVSSLQALGVSVKQLSPWDYLNWFLNSPSIKDEPEILNLANKVVYDLVFLTIENFGLDFVKDEPGVYSLTATLLKDNAIAEVFWCNKNEGLMLLLEEAEYWFPEVWQPALEILGALASRGKSDCMKVLSRLNNNVKYCHKQLGDIQLNLVSSNVFENQRNIHPLQHCPNIVIPRGAQCTTTSGALCEILHWNLSIPFWHLLYNDIKSLSEQLSGQHETFAGGGRSFGSSSFKSKTVEGRCAMPIENVDLKDRVIGFFRFSMEVLKNAPVISNDMINAMEEVFNLINKNSVWQRESELDLLVACLDVSRCLTPLFSTDILNIFASLNFLPEIDHVVMTHAQCVEGLHYRGNRVKTVLELVEINSGRFPFLIAYLQFVHTLFKVEETKVSWTSMAGLMFVLRDVFPHYQSWYFVDENERVEIGWLCLQLLHMSLNGSMEDLSPPQTSVARDSDSVPAPSSGPTFNLIANTCLYSLLNKDAGLALIRIVAIGEQRLFDMVEKFSSWKHGKSAVLTSTVHFALSVLNRIILYKGVQQDPGTLSPTEEEIYKEPKDTDRFHCVLNVASYIHHSFNPKLRVLACRLLTRFADNTRLSLMLCTGLEPYTIRDMFLQPLYSDSESSQLKVAILEFITKCIRRQASLAEAFLNVLQLKECISSGKEQEGVTSGVLTFALCIIDNGVDNVSDPVYRATVMLLHALWLEQCSVVLSYLRLRKGFWSSLCKPLFTTPREDSPVYTSILNILSTEFYWYGKEVHANLDEAMKTFLGKENDYLLKWSLFCTNPSGQNVAAAEKRSQQSEELVVAWRELVITVAKFLPEQVSQHQKEMLAIHLLNGLSLEMASLVNMDSIIALSEAYLMLVTIWKESCCDKKKDIAISQMVRVLAQLSQHYTYIKPKAITTILAFSDRLLGIGPAILPQRNEIELLMKSVSEVVTREVDMFMDSCRDRDRAVQKNQKLTLALCLALRLQSLIDEDPTLIDSWTNILRSIKLIQRLISATAASLKSQTEPKLCLFMLEFLLALTNKESLFRHIDMFDLHYYIWENIPPCTATYPSEKRMKSSAKWKPVFCRGLDLVTFLLENNNHWIRASTYDFIELHRDYLEELLRLLEISDDEADLELVSSGLRLLNHIVTDNVFTTNYRNRTCGLTLSVYQCLDVVVNLLLHPNTIISQFFSSTPRKLVQLNNKSLDQKTIERVQKAQIKLVEIYCKCIVVLGQYSLDLNDVISADRLGIPPWALQPPVNISAPIHDFSTILNAINLFTKVLTKSVRAATPVAGTSDDVSVSLSKLSSVDHDDVRFALEISTHFLISRILLIIVDDRLTFRQKQLFTRDLSSELNILLEYARRVKVDPSLHVLRVTESSGEISPNALDSAIKPLTWPAPVTPARIAGDEVMDGIHFLDPRDAVRRNMFPSSSKEKRSLCADSSSSNGSAEARKSSIDELPMDFLAFAVNVLQLFFRMSEKR